MTSELELFIYLFIYLFVIGLVVDVVSIYFPVLTRGDETMRNNGPMPHQQSNKVHA